MVEEKNDVEESLKNEGKEAGEESFAKLYQDSIVNIKEGQIVKGKIIAVNAKDVCPVNCTSPT